MVQNKSEDYMYLTILTNVFQLGLVNWYYNEG